MPALFRQDDVFPTHVGVFPRVTREVNASSSLPHARGGVSHSPGPPASPLASSPRTWGCFLRFRFGCSTRHVFPTHVGVFPVFLQNLRHTESLPHARGGVSISLGASGAAATSSPRTWGCFCAFHMLAHDERVFPTHVGVFPPEHSKPPMNCCLPHARGGVSVRTYDATSCTMVFPTHVGVFLHRPA